MNGNIVSRSIRAIGSILKNPFYLKTYLLSQNKYPTDVMLPWFSFRSISYLEKNVNSKMEVFEYGSGGSTLFFAPLVKSVTSVENDASWRTKLSNILTKENICNVEILESNWDCNNPSADAFYNSDYIQKLDRKYDVIIIDGMCFHPKENLRISCFEHALKFIKPNGMIVLDDSWRYDDLLKERGHLNRTIFQSIGPCRRGVTRTTVYHF